MVIGDDVGSVALPGGLEMTEITTPDWVKDAIFYQIFPDRFARSASAFQSPHLQPWGASPTYYGFQGGNLEGITEKLDYLQELGITAIYFNPIFQSTTNHRYRPHDYYKVDPLLGDNEAFRKLLNAAHSRNIKVVLDGVFNHVNRSFLQFSHVLECENNSPYIDWFYIKGFPVRAYADHGHPNYKTWAGNKKFPKLNLTNPQARQFILDVVKYWMDFGVDGWRLDAAEEIEEDFWREFREVVKNINPQAYVFAEIWVDEKHKTASRWLQGDQFDAIMNYGFASACIGFFIGDRVDRHLLHKQGNRPKRTYGAGDFAKRIDTMLSNYARDIVYSQYNLLESHDTSRYLTLAGSDKDILKLTIAFQMTYPGAPAIYYGTEIGLEGGRDPDCRRAMPWDRSQWDTDLLAHYKKLIALRKAYPSLRAGEYVSLHADSAASVYAFMRSLVEEKIIVILNNSDRVYPVEIALWKHFPEPAGLDCLISGKAYSIRKSRLQGPALPPRTSAVLLMRDPLSAVTANRG